MGVARWLSASQQKVRLSRRKRGSATLIEIIALQAVVGSTCITYPGATSMWLPGAGLPERLVALVRGLSLRDPGKRILPDVAIPAALAPLTCLAPQKKRL